MSAPIGRIESGTHRLPIRVYYEDTVTNTSRLIGPHCELNGIGVKQNAHVPGHVIKRGFK